MKVDFATFCYEKDAHRLHTSGQLKKQVDSNNFMFDNVIVIYQQVLTKYNFNDIGYPIQKIPFNDFNWILKYYDIKLKSQYQSSTDNHHSWKPHVTNHLKAIHYTTADYIVFADNDCWMVRQPDSWIKWGIELLQQNPDLFIISPNDGEPARKTLRMSQQMFLVKVDDFRNMDFNQPGWDGNVNIPGGPMPEYHAMLEGRIHHYCKSVGKYRYVLPPNYRYFHHNVIREDGMFETDYNKLGWV